MVPKCPHLSVTLEPLSVTVYTNIGLPGLTLVHSSAVKLFRSCDLRHITLFLVALRVCALLELYVFPEVGAKWV